MNRSLSDLTVRESAPKEFVHLPLPRRQQEALVLERDRLPDSTRQVRVADSLDELAKPTVLLQNEAGSTAAPDKLDTS